MKILTMLADEVAQIESGEHSLTLDNDPISFATLFCVTAVAMTYLFYKMKQLKQKKNSDD